MKKDKYIAYDPDNNDYEPFETLEEAQEWLARDDGEGFGEALCGGCGFIAKITHRAKYEVTDEKENYHEHTENCPEDCDEEEWPNPIEFDTVGKIVFEEVED